LQSYIKQNGGAERFLYFGRKTTDEIRINLTFSTGRDVVNGYLSVLRKDNENDTLYIEDFASIHDTKKYKNPILKIWGNRLYGTHDILIIRNEVCL
jgi:hypothetical protein